ncbi:MAG: hypothetical protein CMN17_13200 [Roseovarius sp.]|nr:hypothetical protein [Roseovarius sp.]|tara:strand:- start:1365 stop:2261 length:897 start_codon:yes stop_codon:yes gene_type:complete
MTKTAEFEIKDIAVTLENIVPDLAAQTIRGWLFLPRKQHASHIFVCLAGGSYSKFYYHSRFEGYERYSFAEYMATEGYAVLALDHLGMGNSDKPENVSLLDRHCLATFNHHAVQEVLKNLSGGLYGAPIAPRPVGIGHSMGGMLLIDQQANFDTFEKIAVLGWTNKGVGFDTQALKELAKSPGYLPTDRKQMRPIFHLEDVPVEVIEADDDQASLTPSPVAVDALQPGIVAREAEKISVPVFLCFGERDISPDPNGETPYYKNSPEVSLVILEGSGHNHNFATTRESLWVHIAHWADR